MQALAYTTDDDRTIGQRLLAALRKRGISLRRLSDLSGVSVSQLSLLTRDRISYPRISTIRDICSALGIAEVTLIGSSKHTIQLSAIQDTDLLAIEGVTIVPEVLLDAQAEVVETGRTLAIAASQLGGRARVYVAVVDGGGMTPHVLPGDRVVFDPDAVAESEQLVLLVNGAATLTAWRFIRHGHHSYGLSDGSTLRPNQVRVAGAIIYIMRQPPTFHAP